MINDYSEGGLKMIDIASFNKSLKATWIKKYLDSGNRGKWKNFFNLALGKYGGSHFFELGNLNRKDIDKLKIEDPFIKEIVEIWSDTFFERKIVSKDHFLSLPLLQNSLIRINNAPVFCNNWLTKGITKVKHLMDENSLNFFSLDHFQNRYNIRVKPLMFFGIVSAVKSLQRQIPRTHQQYESPFNTFLKSQKSSRIVYKQLIANKSEKPISCIDKWHKDIRSSTDKNVDWRNVFQAANTCTTSSKVIYFNFRPFTYQLTAICKK